MYKFIVGVLVVATLTPFISYAALTDVQINAVTALVRSFGADDATVQNVSTSLQGAVLGATVACPTLTTTLRRGMSDATTNGQVTELQKFFVAYYGLSAQDTVTGYFGLVTQRTVVRFQTEQGLETVGIVGALTRAKIASLCGSGVTTPITPIIKPGPICPAIAYMPIECATGSLTPRYDANGCQNGWTCTPTATTTAGTLSAYLDASSPGVQFVAGGAQNVVIGAFKFSASGESVALNKISFGIDDYNFNPADLQSVTFWDGMTQIGSALFTPASMIPFRYTSTVSLTQPMLLPQNSGRVLTVKASFSEIGVGQAGTSGHKVQIEPYHLFGTGVTSGAAIEKNYRYTGGAPVSNPAWLFKSYPSVNLLTLPSAGVLDGKLIRFSIRADPHGSVGVAKITFTVEPSGLTIGAPKVYAYSDASFSLPISGFDPDGGIPTGAGGPAYAMSPLSPVQIPAGQTRYFEIRAPVSGTGSVMTTVLGDTVFSEMQTATQPASSFVWSPNSNTVSTFAMSDWTNGHLVPGVMSWGLRASRTNAPALLDPLISAFTASPTTVTSGQTTTLSWASNTGSVDGGCMLFAAAPITTATQPITPSSLWLGNGSFSVTPAVTTTYTLRCFQSWKDGSQFADKTITVSVVSTPLPPKPVACPLVMYTPIICNGTTVPKYDTNGCLIGLTCQATTTGGGVIRQPSAIETQLQ